MKISASIIALCAVQTSPYMYIRLSHARLKVAQGTAQLSQVANTVSIPNLGQLEFPLAAGDVAEYALGSPIVSAIENFEAPNTIQSGALHTYPFDDHVDSVRVLLKTDGRPLNSRIELLQGPNNNTQVVEVNTEEDMDRTFSLILATPGAGNVIRICNTAPSEFPLSASVHGCETENRLSDLEPVLGGDSGVSSSPKLDLQW